jgi:hypothetical protein
MSDMKPNQTIPRKPEDLIYLAGLFDGEGGIGVNTTAKQAQGVGFSASRWNLQIYVSMTDPGPVEWAYKTFGGWIQTIKAQRKAWSDSRRWTLSQDNAIELLKQIYPYLKNESKRKAAALAFKFREVAKQARYREDSHRANLLKELAFEIKKFCKKGRRSRGSVETERSAPSTGMKFQSELNGDVEKAKSATA